eukprot:g57504.t1
MAFRVSWLSMHRVQSYSGPGLYEMDRERASPSSRADPLSKVFRLHRYIASVLGFALLAAPDRTKQAFGDEASLPFPEQLVLQSWGCFLVAIAFIVHAGPSFPAEVRLTLGRALFVCHSLLAALYGQTVVQESFRSKNLKAFGLFLFLFLAYSWALLFTNSSKKRSFSRHNSAEDLHKDQ